MPWQVALAIMIVTSVATSLVQRHYAQKSTAPATFPPAASYLFGVLPVGLTAGFFVFPHAIQWSWWLVMLLALCGASMAISMWAGFRTSRHLTIIANMTIGKVTSITTILLGWTILGESLTAWQLVGGGILLVAALMAIWAPTKNTASAPKHLQASIIVLALVSCVALAIGLVTEKAILGHMQVGGAFLVGWTAQALAMTVLALKDAKPAALRQFWGYELKWSALMGAVNGLTGVFYVYAIFHSNNISLITTLLAITAPLSVFAAYVLLHEREHHKLMWASLAVGIVGLLVSSL